MPSDPLTTTPQELGQQQAECPTKQQTVFIPFGTVNHEWKLCEACGSAHRVVYVNGDKNNVSLRSL